MQKRKCFTPFHYNNDGKISSRFAYNRLGDGPLFFKLDIKEFESGKIEKKDHDFLGMDYKVSDELFFRKDLIKVNKIDSYDDDGSISISNAIKSFIKQNIKNQLED